VGTFSIILVIFKRRSSKRNI